MDYRDFILDLLWYGERIRRIKYDAFLNQWIVTLNADNISLVQTHIYSLVD